MKNMQIKRQFYAALVSGAVLILASVNSGSTAFAGGASPPPATQTHYKFTIINITGAVAPYAYGINDEGVVVGQYTDSAGNYHGFVSRGTSDITTLDVPGSDLTYAGAINDLGDVAGAYNIGSVPNGFILYEGKFVTVNFPGAASTALDGINNLGQIVGTYNDAAGNQYAFVATPIDR
jgi:probable HAF family extracellular repeat protein